MINRFRVSISQPGRIGQFLKDKIWKIVLYVLLLSIICSLPSILNVCSYKGFNTTIINEIDTIYDKAKAQTTEEAILIPNDVKIVSYKLEGKKKGGFSYNEYLGIGINQSYNKGIVNISFLESSIEITTTNVKIKSYSYNDVNLDNLDFYNLDVSEGEFTKLISTLEYIVNDTQGLWGSAIIISNLFINVLDYLIMALLLAIAVMFGSIIPFRFIFRITLYSATIGAVCMLLGNLFNISSAGEIIGFILAFIYTARAMRNIIAVKR